MTSGLTDRETGARRESRTTTIQSILIAVSEVLLFWILCHFAYRSLTEDSRCFPSFVVGALAGAGTLLTTWLAVGSGILRTQKWH